MKWTEIPAGELHAAEQRLRVALGEDAGKVIDKINKDSLFAYLIAEKIVEMMKEFPDKQLTSLNTQWLRAREIMGKNFFGVEEAIKHFGVNPTCEQLTVLSEIPFSKVVLEQCKDTHVLVAVFPLSIIEIRGKVERELFCSHEDAWYNNQSFAKERGEVAWQMISKTPMDNSTSKNWQEQQALIAKDDEVPSAQVMVYTIIGHFLSAGERLFEKTSVRTPSVACDGFRVRVGYFDSRDGLRVNID